MSTLSAIILFISLLCFIQVHNTYQRDINIITNWYKDDADKMLVRVDLIQPDGDNLIANFTENGKIGILFSGVFSDNAVLQREPQHAAVYGTCDTPNTEIILKLQNTDTHHIDTYITTSMDDGDWKVLFNQSYPNGGDYILSIFCNECDERSNSQTLYNITFGDVYFCSGQSNMNLEHHFTFNRDYTYQNITELGKYSNIRFYTKRSLATQYKPYVIPSETTISFGRFQWHQSTDIELLSRFSATCWYFAQSLVDDYNLSNITFGLIQSSVSGSSIEYWIPNNTIQDHCDTEYTECPGLYCGSFYNGMILPFINMTIKGILWYQGENNLKEEQHIYGNIINHTGYGCMQKVMIDEWRMHWSVIPQTTHHLIPFGIVQLAAGTSEGHQSTMPHFRWTQTANYGILPNEQMINTFLAQAYDVGEPWGHHCDVHILSPAPYDWNTTHWLVGPIHPRTKLYVGQRLAMGVNRFIYHNDGIWQGPLIKGCEVDGSNGFIQLDFNQGLLYDENIIIQPFKLWYSSSIEKSVKTTSALEILVNGEWIMLERDVLSVDNDGYKVFVDVNEFIDDEGDIDIKGIRYAWKDYVCCGDLDINHHPCPMNMCPIITSKSRLPAIPFQADIVDNKCKCNLPQQCDGDEYELPEIPAAFTSTTSAPSIALADNTNLPTTVRTTSTTQIAEVSLIEFTKFDEDWPEFICVSDEGESELHINEKFIAELTGEYQRHDVTNLTNITVPYWINVVDSNKLIFYDIPTKCWQIGSLKYLSENLFCRKHIELQQLESPLKCEEWYNEQLTDLNQFALTAHKCVDAENRNTYIQHHGDNDSKTIWGYIASNAISITLFGILFECCCIGLLWIYCKKRRNRRGIINGTQMTQITNSSDDDDGEDEFAESPGGGSPNQQQQTVTLVDHHDDQQKLIQVEND